MSLVKLTKQQIMDMGLREKVMHHKNLDSFYKIKNDDIIEFDSELKNYKKEINELKN